MGSSRVQRRNRAAAAKASRRAKARASVCAKTGKRGYPNEDTAVDAVAVARGAGGGRVYRCDDCGNWHVTSRRKHR